MNAKSILGMTCGLMIAGLPIACGVPAALASQSLIPTPFPGAVGGNAQVLDPEPQHLGGPQVLKDDPYPQIIGDNAQGNPPIARHHRHQHLARSIYQRKYRVDRY